MRLKVDYADGSPSAVFYTDPKKFSKTLRVQNFRNLVSETINIPTDRFNLIFKGKILTDTHTDKHGAVEEALVYHYGIEERNTVQVIVKIQLDDDVTTSSEASNNDEATTNGEATTNDEASTNGEAATNGIEETSTSPTLEPAISQYFNIGELVDAKNFQDEFQGAWLEAKIIGIFQKPEEGTQPSTSNDTGDSLIYSVEFELDETKADLPLKSIRPRARQKVPFDKVTPGSKIMVNYNIDAPTKIGYYYDMIVDRRSARRLKFVVGTLLLGVDETALQDRKICFVDDMYIIEENVLLADRDAALNELMLNGSSLKRLEKPECEYCDDKPDVKCRKCSCSVCGGKDEPHKQIVCDECPLIFHLWCLNPKLDAVPEGDWFCKGCKNDSPFAKPGELGDSKNSKVSKKPSERDWGKGGACAGRTKECTIVPMHHFGPIPGIKVGMCWESRNLASEAGVHRPPVAGIQGRANHGAYSIALSGGYEDDVDEGDRFYYTGSGGRDLVGNKRTAKQSCDQVLTRFNKSLAVNCAAPFNDKKGAEAKNWRKGKPIRVIRGFKGRKHSKYCPEKGYRYDGIYKVVKYWPEKGRSGFKIWRFLLQRDDPTPAPWTKEGKKIIERLGIKMEMKSSETNEESEEPASSKKRKGSKDPGAPKAKINKPAPYVIPKSVAALISRDSINKKIWQECSSFCEKGEIIYKDKVKESFTCVICQDFIKDPVTLECGHSFCLSCLKRQLKGKMYTCVHCRKALTTDFQPVVNESLKKILMELIC